MSSLPTRMKMIHTKMKELEFHKISSIISLWGANSTVLGPIWPNFKLVRDVMDVLVTCKYEEYPIKNEGARVVTTLYINILDAKGQITQESVVVYG